MGKQVCSVCVFYDRTFENKFEYTLTQPTAIHSRMIQRFVGNEANISSLFLCVCVFELITFSVVVYSFRYIFLMRSTNRWSIVLIQDTCWLLSRQYSCVMLRQSGPSDTAVHAVAERSLENRSDIRIHMKKTESLIENIINKLLNVCQ